MNELAKVFDKKIQDVGLNNSEIKVSDLEKFKNDVKVRFDDIKNELSPEEIDIYKNANLEITEVNDRDVLMRTDIDYDEVDIFDNTNLERMEKGKPPIVEGNTIELHHIEQTKDAPLAELKMLEHRGAENYSVLHDRTKESEINRFEFKIEREEHWKARAEEIKTERGWN